MRKLLGAYDVGADVLWATSRIAGSPARSSWSSSRDIRSRYPADVTVYIVMDNLLGALAPNDPVAEQ